ncbi:MAG: hypothetical protein HGA85_00505 [Nanoarchaeota archaeon]|nr:hypothetical protein [Nanoarchaeota archaeon]
MVSIAVKAILILFSIIVVIGLFSGLSSTPIRVLLGLADPANLDAGYRDMYNQRLEMDKETINSINALLFSVNSLVFIDTYPQEEQPFLSSMFSDKKERLFGTNQKVRYTLSNLETVFIEAKDTKGAAAKKIIDSAAKCYQIYKDQGDTRQRCFALDFTGIAPEAKGISLADLKAASDIYKGSGLCDSGCQAALNTVLFNGKSFEMDIDSGASSENRKIDTETELYMCAEPPAQHVSHLFSFRMYLTPDLNHHSCKGQKVLDDTYGMKVTGFVMKQDVGASDLSVPSRFITGYKPNVFYYEQFEETIAEDWNSNVFSYDGWEVVGWNTLFLAFDLFAPGSKKVIKTAGAALLKQEGKFIIREEAEQAGEAWFKKLFNLVRESIPRKGEAKAVVEGESRNLFAALKEEMTIVFNGMKKMSTKEFLEAMASGLREEAQRVAVYLKKEFMTKHYVEGFVDIITRDRDHIVSSTTLQEIEENGFRAFKAEIEKIASQDVGEEQMKQRLTDAFGRDMKELIENAADDSTAEALRNAEKEITAKIGQMTKAQLDYFVKRNGRVLARVSETASKIFYVGLSKEEKKMFIEDLVTKGADDRFGTMLFNERDMQRFIANNKISLETVEAMYEGTISSGQMDEFVEYLEKEVSLDSRYMAIIERNFRTELSASVKAMPKKTKKYFLLNAALIILAAKEESDVEMFHPVGLNSFGYKTAISTPIIYDESLRKDWNYASTKGRSDYYDYFKFYGNSVIPGKTERKPKIDKETGIDYEAEMYSSQKYTGTIKELSRYFVALSKDKRRFWFDQPPERFYLVSPCKADLNIRITQVDCYGPPRESWEGISIGPFDGIFAKEAVYETGKYNPILDRTVDPFDSVNDMTYMVDENGNIVKQCRPKNAETVIFTDIGLFDKPYTPKTIEVDPVIDPALNPNYCYRGIDESQMVADAVFNWGFPIGGTALGGTVCALAVSVGTGGAGIPVSPACFAVGGFVGGVVGGLAYEALDAGILSDGTWHWPYHNTRGY